MYDVPISAARSKAGSVSLACGVIILVISSCLSVRSQTESGSISGLVFSPSGAVIAGAELILVDIDRNTTAKSGSDRIGFYRFESVSPGRYRLQARKEDYKVANITGIVVNTQDSLEENLHLENGSSIESTTIVVETPKVAHTNGSVGSIVDNQLVISIPLNGRSLQTLFTLIPGVTLAAGNDSTQGVAQFTVNGQRNQSNVFSVDGVNVSLGVSPAPAGRAYSSRSGSVPPINAIGGTQSIVGVDELEDFRVQTSSYAAQYGASPGGQFMLTTRSGTDSFHGSASLFFRHDVLDANDWFRNNYGFPRGTVRQWQPGGVFGGPLVLPHLYDGHGRTFFFISFEALSLVLQDNQSGTVPDAQLRKELQSVSPDLSGVVDLSPPPNGPAVQNGFGRRFDPWNRSNGTYSGAVRFDHTFSDGLRGFFRYGDSSSVSVSPGAPATFANASSTRYMSFTGGATWTIAPSLVNEIRANNSSIGSSTKYGDLPGNGLLNYAPRHFDTNSYLVLFSISNGADGEFLQQGATSTRQWQWQVNDNLSWNRGLHDIKLGLGSRWWRPIVNYFHDQASYYFFTGVSNQPDVINTGNVAAAQLDRLTGSQPLLASYSIYADDVVRVTRHMAVDSGLRWEVTQLTSHASAAQASRPAVYRHSYMNISPRLGMAYLVNDTPRWETNLRLGSGVFQDTNDGSALGLLSDPPFTTRTIYSDMPFPLTAGQLDLSGNDAAGAVHVAYPNAFGPGAKLRSPVSYSWSLAVDQTLGGSNKLVASYVGNQGRHLRGGGVISLPAPSDLSHLRYEVPSLNSSYEALQVQFQHRTSGALQVFAAYTWAHALDNAPMYRGGTQPYVPDRANSDADRRHVVRVGGTYTLPRVAWGGPARSLLNGWSAALNIAIQSGAPFSVTNGSALLVLPDGQQTLGLANIDREAAAWIRDAAAPGGWQLNPAAFIQTTPGVLGNSGRNTFRGFPVGQADLAITREYAMNERIWVHVRGEVFNLTNHPSFSNFSSTWGPQVGILTFGQAQTTLGKSLGNLNPLYQMGGPRSVQLAVRLTF